MSEKIIRERRYKAGYVLRTVNVSGADAGYGKPFERTKAYTPSGAYIGDSRMAYRLCVGRGIKPEPIDPKRLNSSGDPYCSIGYCERERKWYGWSHRAICGFGLGDMVFEERFGDDRTPFKKHGRRPIRNMADARLAASRFARSVS